MTKAERIRAALSGERPDRVPYALWTHFPDFDMDPVRLADETWAFYKKTDIDFIKTLNNGMYPIEDLGCEVDYSDIAKGGVARLVSTPVHTAADWDKVKATDPAKGALARELYSLELLLKKRREAGDDVPVIFTCFSPFTTAYKLSNKQMADHLAQGGVEQVRAALDRITQSTCALVKRAIGLGADGIFLASQMTNYGMVDENIYRTYGAPCDRRVLEASAGWFNVLHAHGDNIMFDLLKDYPVHAFNWHVGESLPGMDECRVFAGKCMVGGLERMDITNCNKNAVRDQIFRSLTSTGGKGLILTPGCVIRYPINENMLAYVRTVKEEMEDLLLLNE